MKLACILSTVIFLQCVTGMSQFLGKITLDLTGDNIGNYTIQSQGKFLFFNEKVTANTDFSRNVTLESKTLVGSRQSGKFLFPLDEIIGTESADCYEIVGNIAGKIQEYFPQQTTVKLKYRDVSKDYDPSLHKRHVMFYLLGRNFFETIANIQKTITLRKLDSILFEVNKPVNLNYNLSGDTNVNILINQGEKLTLKNDNSVLNNNSAQNSMVFYIGNNSSVLLESEQCLSGAITEFVGYNRNAKIAEQNISVETQCKNVIMNLAQISVQNNQTVIFNNVDVELNGGLFVIDGGVIGFSTEDIM